MLDKASLLWLGKIVFTIIVLGAVIGLVSSVVANVLFPSVSDSMVFYTLTGGLGGVALILVLRELTRREWL